MGNCLIHHMISFNHMQLCIMARNPVIEKSVFTKDYSSTKHTSGVVISDITLSYLSISCTHIDIKVKLQSECDQNFSQLNGIQHSFFYWAAQVTQFDDCITRTTHLTLRDLYFTPSNYHFSCWQILHHQRVLFYKCVSCSHSLYQT